MPKEIATKTKEVYPVGSRSDSFGETYPIRELIASNRASYKCTHCGDEIFWNTHKKLTHCNCKRISVDGCEFTPLDNFISNGEIVRVGGKEEDYKVITK